MKVKKFNFVLIIILMILIAIAAYIILFNPVQKLISGVTDAKELISIGLKSASLTSENYDEYYLESQESLNIFHYDLALELFPNEEKISANAILKGIVTNNDVDQISLNFREDFEINFVRLNGEEAKYDYDDLHLKINFNNSLIDTFYAEINYEGKPETLGFGSFVFGEENESSVVYTLNEPVFASTWFPCNDHPDDKAFLDFKITNDSSKVSVSNGILIDERIKGARKTYHWKTLYPISTYLIAFYSADYVNFNQEYIGIENDTMDIEYFVFPEHLEEAEIDFIDHPKMLRFMAETFGEYPFIEEKYGVAEFLWQYGAIEHQTITGIGSRFIGGRKFFDNVYIHEVAHQWWGNAVGLKSWDDIWLNEGFASYSEALYYENRNGRTALFSTMKDFARTNFSGRLYAPEGSLFSRTIYHKGAWVLHMLRREIGDSLFFASMRKYFNKYKYENASTEDFISVTENISGKNLEKFFDQWVYSGEGIIEIEYKWIKKRRSGKILNTLILEQMQDEYEEYHFPLEIKLLNGEKYELKDFTIDKKNQTMKFETEDIYDKIIFDPNGWLLLEAVKLE